MFEIFMIVTNSSMVFLTSLIASVVIYDKYCKKYKEEKNQEHENHIEIVSNVAKQPRDVSVEDFKRELEVVTPVCLDKFSFSREIYGYPDNGYFIYTKSSNEPSCVLIEEKHENIQEEPSTQSFLEGVRGDSISLSEDFSDLTENEQLDFILSLARDLTEEA